MGFSKFFSHSESVVCLLLWTNLTASLDALVVTLGHWHTSKFEAGGAPLPLARAGPALPALPISPWFLEVPRKAVKRGLRHQNWELEVRRSNSGIGSPRTGMVSVSRHAGVCSLTPLPFPPCWGNLSMYQRLLSWSFRFGVLVLWFYGRGFTLWLCGRSNIRFLAR